MGEGERESGREREREMENDHLFNLLHITREQNPLTYLIVPFETEMSSFLRHF